MLTNPPPSSGGILIADALELLERLDRPGDTRALAEVIASTNRARDEEFLSGLASDDFAERFLAVDVLDGVAGEIGSRLGSTTHLAVMDAEGRCATVTCSNGSCSGVVVPGTGMHLNNMLGEEDLNPHGFHLQPPGARVPSMMAPTVVVGEAGPEVALGSAGSNRIRSAIVQTIVGHPRPGARRPGGGRRPAPARGGRPGGRGAGRGRPRRISALEADGWTVRRWEERNLYFGGVQAVARDPASGELSGAGDPRRGGVVVTAG